MLNKIRIVLVNTSHPGNIGAAARAMKTMGLENLYLVEPRNYPHEEAITRASGADDILERAVVCDTLSEALVDCDWVVGTTARERAIAAEPVDPRSCALELLERANGGEVALVFGRERSGLSNEELDLCQMLVNIPANENYSSLNLGSAVQVLSYELRMTWLTNQGQPLVTQVETDNSLDQKANFQNLEAFYGHLEETMAQIGFLKNNPEIILRRLRRLYDRAEPTVRELNILRGTLSATQKLIKQDERENS